MASSAVRFGVQAQLTAGLVALLTVAGGVSALLTVRLTEAEADAQVLRQQRRRAEAMGREIEALCREACQLERIIERQRRSGSDLARAVLVAGQRAVAGRPERPSDLRNPMILDVLQGGSAEARVVQRPTDHPRGIGEDHQVARVVRLRGQRHVLLLHFDLDGLRAAFSDNWGVVAAYLAFALGGVLVFALYLSSRMIVRPLRQLTKATAGEGAVPIFDNPAEVAALSRAYADLFGRLKGKNEALEASLRELERARDELVRSEKLATVGRLAAGVAHEVGNPLASVLGYLEYLRDERGVDPALQGQLLERMDKELNRIGEIIRQLLDFSRPAEGGEARTVKPAEVVASALELVKFHPKLKQVEVLVSGEAPAVRVDPGRLRQVLVNLVLNAADALGSGRVQVRLGQADGDAVIEVADEGPGIPEAVVDHLFDPFYTTKPKGEGTGLGLAISQRIVEQSGGRLWLASNEGGATFAIALAANERAGDGVGEGEEPAVAEEEDLQGGE